MRPIDKFRIGVTGGLYRVNTGKGKRPGFPSTDEIFGDNELAGIARQTNFLRGGPFIEFDWRDLPVAL